MCEAALGGLSLPKAAEACTVRVEATSVLPFGRAWVAARSGWILGPELALTRGLSDRVGVRT
eukprot:1387122-Alexandrium_andersonii.AAC.1